MCSACLCACVQLIATCDIHIHVCILPHETHCLLIHAHACARAHTHTHSHADSVRREAKEVLHGWLRESSLERTAERQNKVCACVCVCVAASSQSDVSRIFSLLENILLSAS